MCGKRKNVFFSAWFIQTEQRLVMTFFHPNEHNFDITISFKLPIFSKHESPLTTETSHPAERHITVLLIAHINLKKIPGIQSENLEPTQRT